MAVEEKEVTNSGSPNVGVLIHDVARWRRAVYDQRLKSMKITHSQWSVLENLSAAGDKGLRNLDLERTVGMGRRNLYGLLRKLEKSKLIERESDLRNPRNTCVVPSSKALSLIKELERLNAAVDAEIMRGISEDAEDGLIRILMRIRCNLKAIESKGVLAKNEEVRVDA
jgi:DNA-binding MarR family transcriptional regulator